MAEGIIEDTSFFSCSFSVCVIQEFKFKFQAESNSELKGILKPPSQTGLASFPSLPESFLMRLGVKKRNFGR